MKNDNEKFKNEFKKRLYSFVLKMIKLVGKLPKNVSNEIIIKQLIRSGTSILANYVEAIASSSRKDFTNFFHYSLKSANESKVWLALLKDTNSGYDDEISFLLNELKEISNIFGTSILTLKGRK